jgi:transcriptional regulator with XRE-family HTH domain
MSFGELVAQRRRDLGLSQRQLADRICAESGRPTVTRTEVSRYEREVRLPTRASLLPLAAALELPPAVLAHAAQNFRDRRQQRMLAGRTGLQPQTFVFASVEALSAGVQPLGLGHEPIARRPLVVPGLAAIVVSADRPMLLMFVDGTG